VSEKTINLGIPTDVRLYGSCSTGLALPSSDIDIFITGFEYFPKCQLADLMNELVKEFYK
jgi:non-canonical poly(A) RNA polymerase PAPD5/7